MAARGRLWAVGWPMPPEDPQPKPLPPRDIIPVPGEEEGRRKKSGPTVIHGTRAF